MNSSAQSDYASAFTNYLSEPTTQSLNCIPANVGILDRERNIVFINSHWNAYISEHGVSECDLIGEPYPAICGLPDDDPFHEIAASIGKVLKGDLKEYTFEFRCPVSEQELWFESTVTPFSREEGKEAVLIMHTDSTGRKKALKQKQKYLEASTDVNCAFDEKGRFLEVSDTSLFIWGYHPRDLKGQRYIDLVSETDQFRTLELIGRITSGEPIRSFENNFIRKDSSLIPTLWAIHWDAEERIMYCVARDSTEKKAAEKQLLAYSQKILQILESITDGFYTLDRDWVVTYMNKEAELILKVSREDIIGRRLWDIYKGAVSVDLYREFNNALANQVAVHFEDYFQPTDCWYEVNAYPYEEGLAIYFKNITERKQADEKLRVAKERYDIVTKVTQDAVWDLDLVTGELYRAEGFKDILGLDISEIEPSQEFWVSLIHPDDRHYATHLLYQSMECDEVYWEMEFRIRRSNGEYAFVKDRWIVLKDAKGKAIRIIGALKDISENRYYLTLEKLERDVLQMYILGEKTLIGIIEYYIYGIEALHPGLSCSILEKRGNKLYNLASPHLPQAIQDATRAGIDIAENAGSCGTAAFIKNKVIVTDIQNDRRWAGMTDFAAEVGLGACWSYPILDASGEVVATFGCYYRESKAPSHLEEKTIERTSHILQLILESKKKGEAIKESNERYELVTKATSEAIWDWDIVTNKIYLSDVYYRLFGHDKTAQTMEEAWSNHIHPNDRERVLASFERAFADPSVVTWQDEYQFIKADGSVVFVHDRATILRDESGRGKRVAGAMQNISHRKQREQEREELIKELMLKNSDLQQFTYITSHNFRAPLSNLMGLLALMQDLPLEDPVLQELLDGFKKSTSTLNETINDLINILIIKGSPSEVKEQVMVRDTFDKICGQIKALIDESQADIVLDDSAMPFVFFTKAYLESIFLNLLTNSIKYRSYSRTLIVSIKTEEAGDFVRLIFRDNGIGMDLVRYRDRLFGLNQRFHDRPDSKGMGLYLIKSQIETLGGTIEVDSQVDVGTTFTISIRK